MLGQIFPSAMLVPAFRACRRYSARKKHLHPTLDQTIGDLVGRVFNPNPHPPRWPYFWVLWTFLGPFQNEVSTFDCFRFLFLVL